jgi:glycosyltransferase involved in cell wall biosynthesis
MNEYVLITAARNEESYIRKTLESVASQTRLPKAWIIVSDGSTDRTDEFVSDFAACHKFTQLLRLDNASERSFASKAFALNAAYEHLKDIQFEFVGILDADISLPPDYYAQLIARFGANPCLGLAGAAIVEECAGGRWELRSVDSLLDVGGQMQLFRRRCYEQIGGIAPLRWGGEDTAANVMARRKGWEVRVFADLRACHHRPTGTEGTSVCRSRFRGGMCDYFIGYHPLFELAKCIRRISEPPYVTGSVLRLCGYFWPFVSRQRPSMPADFIDYLRRHQMQRLLRAGGDV